MNLFDEYLKQNNITLADLLELDVYEEDKLDDIDILADKLEFVRNSGEKIVVLPDYDMDGITSGVIGYAGLSELGFNVGLYEPNPSFGHGFGRLDVNIILAFHPDCKHIITCDTGISDIEGVKYAKSKGISVYITDHHIEESDTSVRPYADAIVNPNAIDSSYTYKDICGAFVMHKVISEYASKYQNSEFMLSQIDRLSVFAGIGTVTDMMPLVYENRMIVKKAVDVCRLLNFGDVVKSRDKDGEIDDVIVGGGSIYCINLKGSDNYISAFKGLNAIMADIHEHKSKPKRIGYNANKEFSRYDINETYFGYILGPTFNVMKRLGYSTSVAFKLFFDKNKHLHSEKLLGYKDTSDEIKETYTNIVNESENPYAPYLYSSSAPAGYMGLIANNLLSTSNLPTFVVSEDCDDNGFHKGSGRAPDWFVREDILSNVDPDYDGDFDPSYVSSAGHNGAFGFRVRSDKLQEFYDYMSFVVSKKSNTASKRAIIDLTDRDDITIEDMMELVHTVDSHRPFGNGVEEPLFRVEFDTPDVDIDVMGVFGTDIKIELGEKFSVISWKKAHHFMSYFNSSRLEAVGTLSINEFNGDVTVNLVGDINVVK